MTAKLPAGLIDAIPPEREMPDAPTRLPGANATPGGSFDHLMAHALGRHPGRSQRADVAPPKKQNNFEHPKEKCADSDPSTAMAAAPAQPPVNNALPAGSTSSDSAGGTSQGGGDAADQNPSAAEVTANADSATPGQATDAQTKPGSDALNSLLAADAISADPPRPPSTEQSAAPPSQDVDVKGTVKASKAATTPSPPSGIGSALDTQRMKFNAQKDEIAGRGQQKLPRTPAKSAASTETADRVEAKTISDASEPKKEPTAPLIDPAFPSKVVETRTARVEGAPSAASANAAGQVERIFRMVSQEVVMIKQSGASSLAVSLKVDAHTELFLQLSDHDGQMQAAIRLERGNVAGLSEHWGQLQESLARQNVHLLPLEEKNATRNSTQNPFSNQPGSTAQGESEHGRSRQTQQQQYTNDAPVTARSGKSSRSSAKAKSKTTNPDGWESWA